MPCYLDEGIGLETTIIETLRDHGVTADADALAFLTAHLGGDRLMTRSELDKLACYVGSGTATLDDALACIGDGAALSMDDLCFAVTGGNHAVAQRTLARLLDEGTATIAVLRGLTRHFTRLHTVGGGLADGQSLDVALRSLRPPVFFKWADAFKTQVRQWPLARLGDALSQLLETEAACKSTGAADRALTERLVIRLTEAGAAFARSGGRRR